MVIIDCDKKIVENPFSSVSVALGNFDGLHRGHQALIQKTLEKEKKQGMTSGVLLFKNHTQTALKEKKAQYSTSFLTALDDKLYLLKKLGISAVFLKTFDEAFYSMDKEDFISKFLRKRFMQKISWWERIIDSGSSQRAMFLIYCRRKRSMEWKPR